MRSVRLILPLALLGALSAIQAQPGNSETLRSGCSPDDQQIGVVSAADTVAVGQALAGGEQVCYQITVERGGKSQEGYVLGDALPAVRAFAEKENQAREASFEEQAREEALAEARAAAEKAAKEKAAKEKAMAAASGVKLNPNIPAVVADFGGRDLSGKRVSLSSLGGRVTLVSFWSPTSPASQRQLISLMPIVHEYRRDGLRAIGIGAASDPGRLSEALDDATPDWPQIADREGLAKRYGADLRTGTTLILDSSHRIVGVGAGERDVERKVRALLAR